MFITLLNPAPFLWFFGQIKGLKIMVYDVKTWSQTYIMNLNTVYESTYAICLVTQFLYFV